MKRTVFGQLADGSDVEQITLSGDGLQLSILTYGALIQDLRVEHDGASRPIVLGFPHLAPYLSVARHFGAVAGRCANRIRAGELPLDGKIYQLSLNERNRTHLHGGLGGFSCRNWSVEEVTSEVVRLSLHSAAGEDGYPGAVDVSCIYRLLPERRLAIELSAVTDAPTVVNLATHSYFNLDGSDTIADHRLMIPAECYLPVDDALIPTGERRPVAGTAFDFRELRRVEMPGEAPQRYDHNFCIAETPAETPIRLARLEGAREGIAMEIWSDQPGLQFYDGIGVNIPAELSGGQPLGAHAGLCLEPQLFPDAVHNESFHSPILRPGETYMQRTEYRFFTA